ncbi:MAG: hypothetical protein MI757_10585 [Pirellulales bacterium]|nr:hypothetical protein [Pirellulales bacterium]
MKAERLIEMLADRPFVPLRIHLNDGRSHDVTHPELAIVSRDMVAIGVVSDDDKVPERLRFCTLQNITEVERVPQRQA